MSRVASAEVHVGLVDRLTGPLQKLQNRINATANKLGVRRLALATAGVARATAGLGSAIGASTRRLAGLTALVGLGGGSALRAFAGLVSGTASAADELMKTSRTLGISIEALQEFRHAADLSGVSVQTLDAAIQRLGVNAAQALGGNRSAARLFADLRIPLRDASGAVRNMDSVLTDALGAIAGIEDPMRRNATAMQLFGRSGVDMVKLVADGAEGLSAMRQEAHALGIVLSEDFARSAEAYNDNVLRMQRRLTGLRTMIGAQLLPAFNALVLGVTALFDEHRQAIFDTLTAWCGTLVGGVRSLLDPTSQIRVVIDWISWGLDMLRMFAKPVTDLLGGELATALLGIAYWVAQPIIGPLVAAGVKLLAAITVGNPLALLAGGLLAIGVAALVVYRNWDAIAEWFSGLWASIVESVDGAVAFVVEPITAAATTIRDVLADAADRVANVTLAGLDLAAQLGGEIIFAVDRVLAKILALDWFAAGERVIEVLGSGLRSGWSTLLDWLAGLVDLFLATIPASWVDGASRSPARASFGPRPAAPQDGREAASASPSSASGSTPLPDAPLARLVPFDPAVIPERRAFMPSLRERVEHDVAAPIAVDLTIDGLCHDVAAVRREAEASVRRAVEDWRRERLAGTIH